MPFDICRQAKIPLQVHGCWTTVNKETYSLAVKKKQTKNIKEGEKSFCKKIEQMPIVPAFYL